MSTKLQQDKLPVIEEVFDPMTQRRDGTITPCAPILLKGKNFSCWPKEKVRFFLCPASNPVLFIPVWGLHTHADHQVLITTPDLDKGEYQLVVKFSEPGEEVEVYHFPVFWQVKYVTLSEIFEERTRYNEETSAI